MNSKMEKQTHALGCVLCFRRWSRKSYAVFSSLGKQVRIGVLGLSCSILSIAVHSKDNRDSLDVATARDGVFALDEVVVSAQRGPVLQSELMRVVQVISRAEIEQAPVADLASLLNNLRGIDIRKRGTFGMQADVSVRGGTFDQVLVLINGVNITDPQTGHHNLNVPVNLSSIERIEVLQGPGARLFGPNAFSGAINIITRAPGISKIDLSLESGQHGFGAASLSAGVKTANLNHFVSVNGSRSDGFTQNTDFENINFYYRSKLDKPGFYIDAQAAYTQKAFGANSFYTPRFPDQFEQINTGLASIQFVSKGKVNIRSSAYWRRHFDRFELFRNEAPTWYGGHNYHMTDVGGATANWMHQWSAGHTSMGLDYRFEQIYSTVLGHPLYDKKKATHYDDVFYTNSFRRSGISLMGEHTVYAGSFSLSSGVLVYYNPELENNVSLFPGIDLRYAFHENVRWFASLNRTLRLPTFTDLFYSGPANMGNANLQPEKAISAETGFRVMNSGLHFDLLVFRRWGRDMIDWGKEPGQELWKSMNLTQVNFTGLESGIDMPMGHFLPYLIYGSKLSIQYAYMHADKSAGDFVSNYVLDFARHKVNGSLAVPLGKKAGFHIVTSWTDRQGGYMLYEDGVFSRLVEFDPFWMVDTRVFYRPGNIELYAEVNNLLDAYVVSIANVPQPGRWIRLGVKMGFDL
jgi:vitamin B12 transporter